MTNSGEETYQIKSATGTESVVVMVIAVVVVGDLVRRAYITGEGGLLYAGAAVLLYCLLMLVLGLMRVIRKPTELVMSRTSLSLNGRRLEAAEVDEIMINGLSRRMIGIKPKGRRFVPAALGFRFIEDEHEAYKDLEHWAKANKVEMTQKKFFKWI
jgi:hypothetical protein